MNLPAEIVWKISDYLSPKDVEALTFTSIDMYATINDAYWKRRFKLTEKLEKTFKATFRRLQLFYELHKTYPDCALRINKETPLIELKYTQKVLQKQSSEEETSEIIDQMGLLIMYALQHLNEI